MVYIEIKQYSKMTCRGCAPDEDFPGEQTSSDVTDKIRTRLKNS